MSFMSAQSWRSSSESDAAKVPASPSVGNPGGMGTSTGTRGCRRAGNGFTGRAGGEQSSDFAGTSSTTGRASTSTLDSTSKTSTMTTSSSIGVEGTEPKEEAVEEESVRDMKGGTGGMGSQSMAESFVGSELEIASTGMPSGMEGERGIDSAGEVQQD
ncbi:uncharacterized protein C8Q71DRAFT_738841 [Rhodofomes roseus]|uniref:Uncharacterized protein n=1 Tax=Rhodofomes roseus TaxID=34475 RepID=A0ABQ8KSR6_9APHY|nr:uncharacterized protein C8Q71DRAFT_738841 [Rhodofomes roseus]KAH9841792.1 hypothetical protein C8Q71DRAFT_738841 [Rhodofomes roseus]